MAARSGGVDCIPCEWEAAAQALPGMGRVCVAVPVFMAACVCTWGHTCVFLGRSSVGAQGAATLHCSTPVPVNYKLVYYCAVVSRHPIHSVLFWGEPSSTPMLIYQEFPVHEATDICLNLSTDRHTL